MIGTFQAMLEAGYSIQSEIIPGVDHFDIVEKLQDEDYSLTRKILSMLSE